MYRELDEQSLARLCSENDRRAQEELYTKYAGKLFTLCLRYSDNRDEARDLLHDSILKALSRIDTFSYRGEGSLYAWIRRIAINMALADIRRNKFRFIHLSDTGPEEISEPSEEDFQKSRRRNSWNSFQACRIRSAQSSICPAWTVIPTRRLQACSE